MLNCLHSKKTKLRKIILILVDFYYRIIYNNTYMKQDKRNLKLSCLICAL